jgi:hypothetical protein
MSWLTTCAIALAASGCTVNGLSIDPGKLGLAGALTSGGSGAKTSSPKPTAKASPQAPEGAQGHTHAPVPGVVEGVVATTPTIGADVPAVYKAVYGASVLKVDGDFLVVTISGLPDHGSPYYSGTDWADKAESDDAPGFHANPGEISEVDATYRIPLKPQMDPAHEKSRLGHMGFALNGVPFFNQYQKEGNPVAGEIVSFDQYGGHPAQGGEYHYHVEPVYLTTKFGKDALLGFLLDGFPVYGPEEDGKTVTNADLDAYHGHEHPTADFPDGIYHYHITAEAPYINGDGFYGKPGTVTRSDKQPGGTQPGTAPTGGTQTGGTQPDGTQVGGTQPGGTQPGGSQPGGTQPGGTQPAQPPMGSVTFSLQGNYEASQYPVKVELTPPFDLTQVVATLVFTSAGQTVTATLPTAPHIMFVTPTGGTRTNKGTLNIAIGQTQVTIPLP